MEREVSKDLGNDLREQYCVHLALHDRQEGHSVSSPWVTEAHPDLGCRHELARGARRQVHAEVRRREAFVRPDRAGYAVRSQTCEVSPALLKPSSTDRII